MYILNVTNLLKFRLLYRQILLIFFANTKSLKFLKLNLNVFDDFLAANIIEGKKKSARLDAWENWDVRA